MTLLTEFAPAKINLALHVLGRRADGYHELDSIVAFADVGDRLTFAPSAGFSIAVTGPFAHQLPPSTDNIVHRAWASLAQRFGVAPVAVTLEKNLPVASGIGGGSANAAAALRGLIRLNDLSPGDAEMRAMALALGADVPVCYGGFACRMRGVGERLAPLTGFAPLHGLLVNPGVAVSTAEIFRAIGLAPGAPYRAEIADAGDLSSWRNDLTEAAVALAPAIAAVLARLEGSPGLMVARMSGSGATCFGVFDSAEAAAAAASALAAEQPGWWVKAARLS
jgi:4-diphosphocytidyl-2-C-methyl-D-erythritol kinase